MTAISVMGPGEEPAPVFHENDDPARKSTDNDVEMRDTDLESQHPPAPAGASRRSTSSQSRVPSRRMSKTPLFLPSPSEPPTRQRDRDKDHDPLDIIYIDPSFSSSRPPPPRRRPRKTKKQRRQVQLMASSYRPSLPASASPTVCRLSNGPAHASARQQPSGMRR
ncbi:hypothetical protein EDB84DRAFT_970615 [Lactarius hengduanensis]|nr:hypothetical protein EDB84DRAFT_970615 [Lactarius hengduanensis]